MRIHGTIKSGLADRMNLELLDQQVTAKVMEHLEKAAGARTAALSEGEIRDLVGINREADPEDRTLAINYAFTGEVVIDGHAFSVPESLIIEAIKAHSVSEFELTDREKYQAGMIRKAEDPATIDELTDGKGLAEALRALKDLELEYEGLARRVLLIEQGGGRDGKL